MSLKNLYHYQFINSYSNNSDSTKLNLDDQIRQNQVVLKIAVVGYGATGVGFIHQLVTKLVAANENCNISIYIFEPSKNFCTGLAYSTKHKSMILNMRAGTMSIKADDINHFANTFNIDPNSYPPRYVFGKYLRYCHKETLKMCKKIGINTTVVKTEVVDIQKKGKKFILKTNKGTSIDFNYIVMCLGNIPSGNYAHLNIHKNYFNSPYQNNLYSKLDEKEDVVVVGTSLTAIDAAIALKSNGFKGRIHFVSRRGYLPGVQGQPNSYKLRFLTKEKLNLLTDNFNKKISLEKIISLFSKELQTVIKKPDLNVLTLPHSNKLSTLDSHIKLASTQTLLWQPVLYASSSLIPHIWNGIQLKDRIQFMKKYYMLWCSYRHCMPLINAKQIFSLIKKGQLQIFGGLKNINYDQNTDNFITTFKDGMKITTKYLINSIGTEYNLEKSRSPLIKNLLKKGFLMQHPCGGANVTFDSMELINVKKKVVKNLFFTGPLTRGVHFYTNAVEMDAKRNEQISNVILADISKNIQKKRGLKIAFFVGNDITSHLIINEIITPLLEKGHAPYIFFLSQSVSPNALPQLKELFFHERTFLNEYVYPYIETKVKNIKGQTLLSPSQIKKMYRDKVVVKKVKDVNEEKFLQYLQKKNVTAGVSLRCYQKFSPNLIDYFSKKSQNHKPFFVNLHPGLLPKYRGVTTYCRAMQNGEKEAGFTLHFVDKNWDSGPIIAKKSAPLNYKLSVIENMCSHRKLGIEILLSAIDTISKGQELILHPQEKSLASYYSHPTKEDLIDFKRKKIKLVRTSYFIDFILKKILELNTIDHRRLKEQLYHSQMNLRRV